MPDGRLAGIAAAVASSRGFATVTALCIALDGTRSHSCFGLCHTEQEVT